MAEILITKSNGDQEVFAPEKLEKSLAKANVSIFLIEDILRVVRKKIRKGMTTSQIYEMAFKMLHKKNQRSAYRYSIKRSLLSLGPTGFPFENFLGSILEKKGYHVEVGKIIQGECIEHEVDIIAHNTHNLIIAEVKFHNDLASKTDTKVGLYVKARFDDLKRTLFDYKDAPITMTKGMIITNTKFTHNVIKYAQCVGIDLIGWDYPQNGNLYDMIEETNLHPLTCLVELPKAHKQILLDKGVIACKSLERDTKLLDSLGLSAKKKHLILEEIKNVCH
jgi:CYTH domain-containing protein